MSEPNTTTEQIVNSLVISLLLVSIWILATANADMEPFILGEQDNQSYKQLGNAVNVNMIIEIQSAIDSFLISQPTIVNLE